MKKILILGYGYAGHGVDQELEKAEYDVQVFRTSRTKAEHIHFDFENPDTWENIPEVDGTIWTFPAKNLETLKAFLKDYGKRLGKIVIVGSTGHFVSTKEDEIVDERHSRDTTVPRVVCENYIVSQQGVLVCSAGIYGPKRNPMDWVKQGLVEATPKYLNVVHQTDLGQFLVKALFNGEKGMMYIAADGRPKRWKALIETWSIKHGLKVPSDAQGSPKMSKFIMPEWTLEELDIDFKFFDVYEGVEDILSGEN